MGVRIKPHRVRGRQLEEVREVDPDGRIIVHHRLVDTLGRMLKSGTIDQAMHDAGRDFQAAFILAQFDSLKESSLKVKPGSYQVAWRQDNNAHEVLLPEVLEVRPNQTTPAHIDTGLRLVAPEGMAQPYFWKLVDAAGEAVAQYNTLAAVPVPGGAYRLLWRQTSRHDEADLGEVDLVAGELTEILLDQGVNLALPEWMPEPPYIIRFTDARGRAVQVQGPGASVLGPGRYQVGFRLTSNHLEVPWGELEVPQQGFVDPAFNSGLAFLTTGGAPYYVWAVNLDTQEEVYVHNLWGPLPLPPGRYRIDLRPDPSSDRFTIIEEVPIGPGELIQVQM